MERPPTICCPVKLGGKGSSTYGVPAEDEAETATRTPARTAAGTVMGTMGYM
jgi:hypothetical protein